LSATRRIAERLRSPDEPADAFAFVPKIQEIEAKRLVDQSPDQRLARRPTPQCGVILEKTMTVMSKVAVCSVAAALLTITAADRIVADGPKTANGGMAAAAFNCKQAAQWSHAAALSPLQATDPSAPCEASQSPMAMNVGWELFVRFAGR
jgi:hypothetical protein